MYQFTSGNKSTPDSSNSSGGYTFYSSRGVNTADLGNANNFRQSQLDEEEKRRQEEEQARIDAEKNKSTASKVWGFAKNTAQEIGSTVAGSARAIWNDPKKTLPMAGNTIMNEIDKASNAVVDLTFNKIPSFLMGQGWVGKDANTAANEQRITTSEQNIQSQIISPDQRKLFEGSQAVGQALPYFLLPTTSIGAGVGAGVKATTGAILRGIGTRALARGVENAAGSAILDIAMGKKKDEVLKNAMTNFVAGTVMSATLEGAIKGISAAKGYKYNQIARQTIDEYGNHLISGTKDPIIATELLDNGAKSPKISSSLEESFAHIGEDVTSKETLMATPEGQNALAGTVVHSKMSADVKKAVYKEIVESGLFKIEKGDSIDEVIQKGISSVLANGENVRPQLNLTGKYADSVLGVINPELNKVADAAVATSGPIPEQTDLQKVNQAFVDAQTPPKPSPLSNEAKLADTYGTVKEWGTQNQYVRDNPFRGQLDTMKKTGNYDTKVIQDASRWEMQQVLKDKPAYISSGTLSPVEIQKFAKTNNLKVGYAKDNSIVIGKTQEAIDKVINATGQRDLGLALGYKDITPKVETPPETQPKTAQTPPEAIPTKTGTETPLAPQTEQKFPEKTGVARKISDDLMNSEKASQVYTELETAQAGFRKAGPDGTTISGKSTFPEWVPNEYTKDNGVVVSLRDRKLFDQVQDHFINGTVPTDELQLALYDVVHNELRKRMDLPAVEFPTEGKIVKAQRLAPEKPVKVSTNKKAISNFSKRYNEMYHPEKAPTTHDIAHNDAQITKALEITRIDYDRAIRIATGVERSDETLANATAMAVLDKARAEGDTITEKLVLDRTVARSTRAGQETQILSKLKSIDPAYDAVKTIRNTQNKAFEVKTGEKVAAATDKTITEIDSHIQEITGDKFSKFLNDHKC